MFVQLKIPLRTGLILVGGLLLVACGSTQALSIPDATAAATAAATAIITGESPATDVPDSTSTPIIVSTAPATTATEEVALAATPEPAGLLVGLIVGQATPSMSDQSLKALTQAADSYGLTTLVSIDANPRAALNDMLNGNAMLIILVGSELASLTQTAARANSDVYFVGVDQLDDGGLDNMLVLGGPASRQDELGFVAGMLAGFASRDKIVGSVVAAETIVGRKYAGGFLHGVRISCGECAYWPVELESYDDPVQGEDAVRRLRNVNVDVVFAAPGPAGTAALQAAATQSMWVVGVGEDYSQVLSDTSGYLLPSPVQRIDIALFNILGEFVASGQLPAGPIPLSYSNDTLGLALNDSPGVTPGEIRYIQSTIERLRSGELITGIDPLTGEEI